MFIWSQLLGCFLWFGWVLRDSLCILGCGVFAGWFVSFLFACLGGLSWHLGFVWGVDIWFCGFFCSCLTF